MMPSLSFMDKLRFRFNYLQHKYSQYRLSTNETEIVNTEYGQVRGLKRTTIYAIPYYGFEGIPYAKPPIGELRFKAPEKLEPWQGVLDCGSARSKATQMHPFLGVPDGSEDCLYVNVYARNLKPGKPAPVMVWIHGGAFVLGEANRDWYGPDYFMEKDVVLVTVQYRLGVFGFLHLSSPELNVPGNAGLKDQIAALKWVRNNISNFGGDPDSITLFGESAGGASTHYLCITEQTRGLFHRAILMSGTATACWALNEHEKFEYTLAKLAGYKGDESDEKQIFKYLTKCKASDLATLEPKVLAAAQSPHQVLFAFVPVIEKYETEQCVVSKNPRELMRTAWSNTIPIMVGCTSAEGWLMASTAKVMPAILQKLQTCKWFVPEELWKEGDIEENAEKLRKLHAGSGNLTPEEYCDISGYLLFYFPQYRFLLSRSTYARTVPTYIYRFDFASDVLPNPWRYWVGYDDKDRVSHGDELSYLFSHMTAHRVPRDSSVYKTIQRMTGIWSTFAETGDPNNREAPGMDLINWQPIKDTEPIYKCLNIGEELKIMDWPELENSKVWENIFSKRKELLY